MSSNELPKIIQIIAAPQNTEYFSVFSEYPDSLKKDVKKEDGDKKFYASPVNYFALFDDGQFSPYTACSGYFEADLDMDNYVGCFTRAELIHQYGDKIVYRNY